MKKKIDIENKKKKKKLPGLIDFFLIDFKSSSKTQNFSNTTEHWFLSKIFFLKSLFTRSYCQAVIKHVDH